jgi:hypothetical protein
VTPITNQYHLLAAVGWEVVGSAQAETQNSQQAIAGAVADIDGGTDPGPCLPSGPGNIGTTNPYGDWDHDGIGNALEQELSENGFQSAMGAYNPCLKDTDGDGVPDGLDLDPLVNDVQIHVRLTVGNFAQLLAMDEEAFYSCDGPRPEDAPRREWLETHCRNQAWGEPYLVTSFLSTGQAGQPEYSPINFAGITYDTVQDDARTIPLGVTADEAGTSGLLDLPADASLWKDPNLQLVGELGLGDRDWCYDDSYGFPQSGNHFGWCSKANAQGATRFLIGNTLKVLMGGEGAVPAPGGLIGTANPVPGTHYALYEGRVNIPGEANSVSATLDLSIEIQAHVCGVDVAQAVRGLASGQWLANAGALPNCHV